MHYQQISSMTDLPTTVIYFPMWFAKIPLPMPQVKWK